MQIRNKLNSLFKEKDPVIATVTLSREKKNVVLTTTEFYNSSFLEENKEKILQVIPFQRIQKNEPWAEIVVHGIPTQPFIGKMELLKEEIETFNHFKLLSIPRWISKKEKIEDPQTRFASIKFAVQNKETQQNILKNQVLQIAGLQLKVLAFTRATSSSQCNRCQKFGHAADTCRLKICKFCAGNNHLSKDHCCPKCGEIEECEHIPLKCLNYGENHKATS